MNKKTFSAAIIALSTLIGVDLYYFCESQSFLSHLSASSSSNSSSSSSTSSSTSSTTSTSSNDEYKPTWIPYYQLQHDAKIKSVSIEGDISGEIEIDLSKVIVDGIIPIPFAQKLKAKGYIDYYDIHLYKTICFVDGQCACVSNDWTEYNPTTQPISFGEKDNCRKQE